ncbi:radical SAM protein [Proteiniborus sp. MB09-C3]|uniref:radical SAM protein n=1 Tax=Proteiniborus sp. MB09-C3 TaxID=3050072 RepID=UPI00255715E8|nr:radical SAM protein [Proteiniborus sp. MB09-C3]WIV11349.1 radical SAM protein [Proteiniborus sp. MB09-C3]
MDIQEFASKKRIPLIGNFELTRKCPLNCLICYNERKKEMPEMNYEQIVTIINELADMGCFHINLTGGDPLIRSDFCNIYKQIVLKGMFPSVETSLVFLPEEVVELFSLHHPEKLFVSLYAFNNEVYQKATDSNIDVVIPLNNILTLKNKGIDLTIRTPVTVINLNQVGLIADFARQNGLKYTPTCKIFWKQNGEKCDSYRCSSDMIKEYLDKNPIYEMLYQEALLLETKGPEKKTCKTGIYDFNINPYGQLNFCITFWKPEYDLLTSSMREAWEKWYPMFRRSDEDYCLAKEIFSNGEQCPWGKIYSDPDFDTSKSLIEHARELIDNYKNLRFSDEFIMKKLKLAEVAYEEINKNK